MTCSPALALSMLLVPHSGTAIDPLAPVGDGPSASPQNADANLTASPGARALTGDPLARSVRAIWVVRDALADPGPHRVVDLARELGANTLFVQVSGRGDAWYDSDLLPRAEELPIGHGDPLAELVKGAQALGLSVHAWINVGLIWSAREPPASPLHVVNRHPDWIACLPDGAPLSAVPRDSLHAWFVEGLFAETAHEGYRAHVASVAREILERYALDGIHLDYIRRPVIDTGYDVRTVGRFLDEAGLAAWQILPSSLSAAVRARFAQTSIERGDPEPEHFGLRSIATRPGTGAPWYHARHRSVHPARAFRWPDYGEGARSNAKREWNRYRRDAVTAAVAAVRRVVDDVSRGDGRRRLLTAAVIPDPERAHMRFAQDWPLWVERGLVDLVVPMCYARGREAAGAQIDAVLSAVGPDRVIAGAGAYQQSLATCALTLRDMLDRDVRGVCVFSWGSLDEKCGGRGTAVIRRAWRPEPAAGETRASITTRADSEPVPG